MGMDSRRLSARKRQPGHDRTFTASETNFVEAAHLCLDPKKYEVVAKPKDLRAVFPGQQGDRPFGVEPEASITSLRTGKKLFVEVKKQRERGNAEERAMKHHTVQFYRTLHDIYGYPYHPYVTVFCEELATLPRYTRKFKYLIEPDQYFLWVDYNLALLCKYLKGRCAAWLDVP